MKPRTIHDQLADLGAALAAVEHELTHHDHHLGLESPADPALEIALRFVQPMIDQIFGPAQRKATA